MLPIDLLKKKLETYRRLLVNFSRRNKELYFKPSTGASLNLSQLTKIQKGTSDKHREKIEKEFLPIRTSDGSFSKLVEKGGLNLNAHFGLDIAANIDSEKRIDKVRLADDKYQREYGISGAWILGPFLCWHLDPNFEKTKMAITPIFKLPIDIKKPSKGKYKLVLEDDTLQLNPTFTQYLKDYLKLEISLSDNNNSIEQALKHVMSELENHGKSITLLEANDFSYVPRPPKTSEKIKDEDGNVIGTKELSLEEQLSDQELELYNSVTDQDFKIIDCIYVDQINASKMSLLKDYDAIMNASGDHPILNELLLGAASNPSGRKNSRPSDKELNGYKEKDCHFVVETDSSQHRAVDAISKERAVVIEGPPGTGKSQTITNMIADLVAKGNRVLFVSEKRAALDVVYNRICQSKLAPKAALIHSSDLNRSELYGEFIDAWNFSDFDKNTKKWESVCEELDQVKNEISTYQQDVASTFKDTGLSVQDILVLKGGYVDIPEFPIMKKIAATNPHDKNELIGKKLRELKLLINSLVDRNNCPYLWAHSIDTLNASLNGKADELAKQSEEIEILVPDLLSHCEKSKISHQALMIGELDSEEVSEKIDPLYRRAWDSTEDKGLYKDVIEQIKILQGSLIQLDSSLAKVNDGINIDDLKFVSGYLKEPKSIFSVFTSNYWKAKNLAKTALKEPIEWEKQCAFDDALKFVEHKVAFKKYLKLVHIDDLIIDTDFSKYGDFLEEVILNLDSLQKLKALEEKFSSATVPLTSKDVLALSDNLSIAKTKRINIELLERNLKGQINSLIDTKTFLSSRKMTMHEIVKLMTMYLNDLELIVKIKASVDIASESLRIDDLDRIIFNELADYDKDWCDCFVSQGISSWYEEVRKHKSLLVFDRKVTNDKINNYKTLVESHRELSRSVVHTKTQGFVDETTSMGIKLLEKEANKQKRVLSPREIMEKGALNTMLAIKPIWLMSPLSISQILPNEMGMFDYIIFDEASQVRVEDAIPSIFRAKKMIVVGDRNQMPPTMFFNPATQDFDDEEEDYDDIPESILEIASLIYPSELLTWHYRSRYESLIAFSNRAFYGGRLITAPSPDIKDETSSLNLHQVKDATFSASTGNMLEANAIVECLANIVKNDENASVGIIAMGRSQQKAIEEAIDLRCSTDSPFSSIYNKLSNRFEAGAFTGLFVKNLENCQGDERDTILISVGYAPNKPGGKLRRNFGPLSKPGGRRRLNVAITRAKERIHIFTSFDPDILASDAEAFTKNPESATFARYLKYVKSMSSNNFNAARAILDTFPMSGSVTTRKPSGFALDVMRSLEKVGFSVVVEIGSSGYFIDLAIEHPSQPGSYIAGIECDGHIFHFHRKDKDIARQTLLESRGWKILRVDSIDWSKNRSQEICRLQLELENIIRGRTQNDEVASQAM